MRAGRPTLFSSPSFVHNTLGTCSFCRKQGATCPLQRHSFLPATPTVDSDLLDECRDYEQWLEASAVALEQKIEGNARGGEGSCVKREPTPEPARFNEDEAEVRDSIAARTATRAVRPSTRLGVPKQADNDKPSGPSRLAADHILHDRLTDALREVEKLCCEINARLPGRRPRKLFPTGSGNPSVPAVTRSAPKTTLHGRMEDALEEVARIRAELEKAAELERSAEGEAEARRNSSAGPGTELRAVCWSKRLRDHSDRDSDDELGAILSAADAAPDRRLSDALEETARLRDELEATRRNAAIERRERMIEIAALAADLQTAREEQDRARAAAKQAEEGQKRRRIDWDGT